MLAPFEYPRATTREGSKAYSAAESRMNFSSSAARRRISSSSKTPSRRRRKKRRLPFSSTFPRGLRRAARGASPRAMERRSFSSPPVPWSRRTVVGDPEEGTNL